MDRRNSRFKVRLPERQTSATLDILGRGNGPRELRRRIVHDRKGLQAPVTLTPTGGEVTGWQVFKLPLDEKMLSKLHYRSGKVEGPAFWRATVNLEKPGDTFLDMRPWGKGVAWVNGRCLGRFWNIGPAQTMYLPGPWLKPGKNDFVILDLLGPEKPVLGALDQPILNQLRPDLDFAHTRRPVRSLNLSSAKPVLAASFAPGTAMQEVKFSAPAKGRYFCLESLNAHDGQPDAAIAELDLIDESGQPLSHESWAVAYVDSEERDREDGTAENAIDGQIANFWHTQWGNASPGHPTHCLVLDLGQAQDLAGFRYVPRQGAGAVGGRIKDYRIYVGDNLVQP